MTITEAFQQIKKDETLCAGRVGSNLYYCFVNGTFSAFMILGDHVQTPFPYANKKGQESFGMEWIFSDFEVIPISDL